MAQYEGILPVYQSRLKDTEELNKKLDDEKAELAKNIERLRQKLNRAEALVFSMGTPEAIRQREPVMGSSADLFPRLFPPSSQDDHNKVGAPDGAERNSGEPVDLTVSPNEPGDTIMETTAAPVIKLSFKEIISTVQKQNMATKNIEGMAGTSEQPTPPRLITLSTLGNKNEDISHGQENYILGASCQRTRSEETPSEQHGIPLGTCPSLVGTAPPTKSGMGEMSEIQDRCLVVPSCIPVQHQ